MIFSSTGAGTVVLTVSKTPGASFLPFVVVGRGHSKYGRALSQGRPITPRFQ